MTVGAGVGRAEDGDGRQGDCRTMLLPKMGAAESARARIVVAPR